MHWVTPDNRRSCPDFDAADGVHAVRPARGNAGRRKLRVRELLKNGQAQFWRMTMELLLILPAAFFAAVLWCTGARLWHLLVAAFARRSSRMAISGRMAGD